MASMAYINFASIERRLVPNSDLEVLIATVITQTDADTIRNLMSELAKEPQLRHYPKEGVWRIVVVF